MTAAAASPVGHEAERDASAVRAMFDRIAARYDLVNTVLSFGADGGWRRRAARATALAPKGRALDVACGSGKLTGELLRLAPRGLVVGLDFSDRMLRVAADAAGPRYVRGDGLRLPFADGSFDAVTVAFGLRNFADPELGLREMRRVLQPGGRAVVLEFVRPGAGPIGAAYRAYLGHVLPRVGGWVSGDPAAYAYLSATVHAYHTAGELMALGTRAGLRGTRVDLLTHGTVALLAGSS